MGSISRIWRQK